MSDRDEPQEVRPHVTMRAIDPVAVRATTQALLAESRALQQRVHEIGTRTRTPEEWAADIAESGMALFGASAAVFARLVRGAGEPALHIESAVEVSDDLLRGRREFPLSRQNPLSEAVATGRMVECGTRAEILERFPVMQDIVDALGSGAVVAVPVKHLGVVQGAIGLIFPQPRTLSPAERSQLRALSTRYARALFTARMYFAERDARAQAERAVRAAGEAVALLALGRQELESRIAERTEELARANRALQQTISERERAQEEQRALRQQLTSSEEEERRRIARELHDQLGQHLTAFRLGLEEVRRILAPDDRAHERLAQLQGMAGDMTRDVRYLALALRPPELDDVGLESALDTYVRDWGTRYGVAADLEVTGSAEYTVPPDIGIVLYRIAQEALTNVAKHAQATEISVILEKGSEEVRLIVDDDGTGFDVATTTARARRERRLGLAGMQERAALVRGTITVESTVGQGTTVYVRLPSHGETSLHGAGEHGIGGHGTGEHGTGKHRTPTRRAALRDDAAPPGA